MISGVCPCACGDWQSTRSVFLHHSPPCVIETASYWLRSSPIGYTGKSVSSKTLPAFLIIPHHLSLCCHTCAQGICAHDHSQNFSMDAGNLSLGPYAQAVGNLTPESFPQPLSQKSFFSFFIHQNSFL